MESKLRNEICLITEKKLNAISEEMVKQNYIKILIQDYGYEKEDIQLEYAVKKSPSDSKKSIFVDIVVFENGKPKIFIETKSSTVNEGVEQLKHYMDFENVKYGVWTNGSEDKIGIFYLEKIVNNKKIDYKEIFNIPEKGLNSINQKLKKRDLKQSNNLKSIFKQIRGFISANSIGTTRDEKILSELMSILICKIYDEKYKVAEDYIDFIVVDENPHKTANRIKDIFENKVKIKYPMVFGANEKISLDENSITYCVAQLQKYSITTSSAQAISDAFENIIGYASKGSQGQFFTPKNIVELMVYIIKPERYKSLIDPACGTSGFLISTMNYVWNDIDSKKIEEAAKIEEKKEYAMTQLYGIEKDDFLAKISKSYMAILGDGKSRIFIEDSLNDKFWTPQTKANIRDNYFDYVLTNPPFGKDIKVQNETKNLYQFDSVDIIFLEKSLNLLKNGGILGIILPETIFHSANNKKVRESIFYKHNIMCLIDIPHDTFRPFNNAKCDIIFLQKNTSQQENILTIKIDNIGHNHLGEIIYKYDLETNTFDKNSVNDDTQAIIESLKNNIFINNIQYVKAEKIIDSDLLVARNYFEPELNMKNAISLEKLINEEIIMHFDGHGSPEGHLKGLGEFPYIRVKDIVNLEIYINHLDSIPRFEYDRLYSSKKQLKVKDIAFVRRGSYRIGDVGMLYAKDLNSILTREILILRVQKLNNEYGITPHNLLYLLNSQEVKKQLKNKVMIDTTLPNIADRWKKIYIPVFDKSKMLDISKKMENMYLSREKFWNELKELTDKENKSR